MKKFSGIYPALVTPMREDLTPNMSLIRHLVDFHVSAGVDGLWISGATGEAELLSVEERRAITEMVIEAAAGRIKVIVHVGSVAPLQAVELAVHAERCGADSMASVPPHFFSVNEQMVVDHYRRLSDACGLPLFMYHLPGCTQVPITIPLAERLLELPSICGIKFSEHNIVLMRQIRNLDPDRLTVLFGMDAMLLGALVMGADGGVGGSYNYIPEAFVRIHSLHGRGDLAPAQALQRAVTDFNQSLRQSQAPIVVSKFAMSLRGIDCGPPRPPHAPLPDAEQQRIRQCWDDHREWIEELA